MRLVRLAVSVWIALLFAASVACADGMVTRSTKASFEDVWFEIGNAIVARGLTISSEGEMAEMLERTSSDVGGGALIFKRARFVTFCSAQMTHKLVKADVKLIGLCPFELFAFETLAKPGEVVVGHRSVLGAASGAGDAKAVLAEAEAWLDGIVADVTK